MKVFILLFIVFEFILIKQGLKYRKNEEFNRSLKTKA